MGHVPKNFHKLFHQFLLFPGFCVKVEVTAKHFNRGCRYGLEIPVSYKLTGPEKAEIWIKKYLHSLRVYPNKTLLHEIIESFFKFSCQIYRAVEWLQTLKQYCNKSWVLLKNNECIILCLILYESYGLFLYFCLLYRKSFHGKFFLCTIKVCPIYTSICFLCVCFIETPSWEFDFKTFCSMVYCPSYRSVCFINGQRKTEFLFSCCWIFTVHTGTSNKFFIHQVFTILFNIIWKKIFGSEIFGFWKTEYIMIA